VAWLSNHTTKTDIDSMAWGFNSVRQAMHYNLFTLPRSEAGPEKYLATVGFVLTDSLVSGARQIICT
jgi:hypothetical protein